MGESAVPSFGPKHQKRVPTDTTANGLEGMMIDVVTGRLDSRDAAAKLSHVPAAAEDGFIGTKSSEV
jgi:hypothetical protein